MCPSTCWTSLGPCPPRWRWPWQRLSLIHIFVGLDKEEIVQIARKIGTFETSILPYEDCCTVFTPRHPRLRPILTEVEAAEEKLDVDAMVQAAVEGIERVQV